MTLPDHTRTEIELCTRCCEPYPDDTAAPMLTASGNPVCPACVTLTEMVAWAQADYEARRR